MLGLVYAGEEELGMTWQAIMKKLISVLSRVGRCRLPGNGPSDHPWQCLFEEGLCGLGLTQITAGR